MKYLLMIAMLAVATPALADSYHEQRHEERQSARDSKEKAHLSQVLSGRISATQRKLSCLQAAQTCVNSASDSRSLSRCHTECGG